MCDSMRLFTDTGAQAPLLVDVWDRSSLDLTPEQMMAKFSAVKDLSKIWRLLRWEFAAVPPSLRPPKRSQKAASKDDLCWSQLDTILIDDTSAKAVLQPYNHLHITSMVQPSKMNGLSTHTSSSHLPVSGVQSEYRPDTCLVQIVAMLEKLRYQSNVSNAIMLGEVKGLDEGEEGDAWAKAGFEILKEKNIRATRDFDSNWAERVLNVGARTRAQHARKVG